MSLHSQPVEVLQCYAIPRALTKEHGMKKLIIIPLAVAAIATAGCGSQGATKTVQAPAKTVTVTKTATVSKTPESCITALYGMKHVAGLEMKALKEAVLNGDVPGATALIKKATKQIDAVVTPFTSCVESR
jgi:hypothetical protein